MARATFVLRDGQLVERHRAPPPPQAGRRLGRAPAIRADGMDAIRSMADGRMYDSRSAYYASVRRAGCEIVGDDVGGFSRPPGYDQSGIEEDIKRAIAEHEADVAQPVTPGPQVIGGWD
jgi:hypothetical protein